MRLFVIRHGQGLNNIGKADIPDCVLSSLGERQVRRIPAFFRKMRVDRIFCSPLMRTIQTATPLAEAKDLPIVLVPEMAEHFNGSRPHYGTYAWESCGSITAKHPRTQFIDRHDPQLAWWPKWPESLKQVDRRVLRFFRQDLKPLLATGKNIVVVGHGASTASLKRLVCPKGVYPAIPGPGDTNAVIYEYHLNAQGRCVEYGMHTKHIQDCLSPKKIKKK